MKEETRIELMKIASALTRDVVENMKHGVTAGKTMGMENDIRDVFSDCLGGVKEQYDKLGLTL